MAEFQFNVEEMFSLNIGSHDISVRKMTHVAAPKYEIHLYQKYLRKPNHLWFDVLEPKNILSSFIQVLKFNTEKLGIHTYDGIISYCNY